MEELRSLPLHAGVLVLRGQATAGGDAYHLWRDVLKLLALRPSDELAWPASWVACSSCRSSKARRRRQSLMRRADACASSTS